MPQIREGETPWRNQKVSLKGLQSPQCFPSDIFILTTDWLQDLTAYYGTCAISSFIFDLPFVLRQTFVFPAFVPFNSKDQEKISSKAILPSQFTDLLQTFTIIQDTPGLSLHLIRKQDGFTKPNGNRQGVCCR